MKAVWCAIIFTGSLILAVSAGKSDIIKTTRESWISMENLATMLKVSFNSLTCCNVFMDGNSVMVEDFFNGFIKTYPYGYTLNRPSYACSENLMISTSADRLVTEIRRRDNKFYNINAIHAQVDLAWNAPYVSHTCSALFNFSFSLFSAPTTIASLNFLVVVTNDVEESTSLLNGSLFGNANVNVVSLNGMWTLSENYLTPRVFKKVSSLGEMAHEQRIANFRGREVQAAAYYKPPYCYLRTTVNRTVNGIKGEYFIAKDKSELDGIDFKVFLLIAERLNFTWTIREASNKPNRYGVSNGTHWNGGMIGQLVQKEVDIAFTCLWIEATRHPFTNLTKPFFVTRLRFLVPRPKPYTSFWALIGPLSPEVWCAVVAMLIVQSIYVYTSAWINPRIPTRFRTFVVTWTELLGRLIGTTAPRSIQGLKLQLQLWHLIGILLVTAYSSRLAADLTNPRFEKRINTPRDFIKANLSWGTLRNMDGFSQVIDYTDPYAIKFVDHYEQYASEDDRDRLIVGGNYAILGNMILSIFFPDEPVKNELLKDFRLMSYSAAQYYTSFAVQPWLLKPMDMVILQLKETGMLKYHIKDVLHRRTASALREVLIEHDGKEYGPRVLQLTPLGAGYVVLFVGLFISSVVFYLELRSASRKKSIREVLLKIKRNREIWQANKLKRRREPSELQKMIESISIEVSFAK